MEHIDECINELRQMANCTVIKKNEPMRYHTTFAIGGPAELFLLPKTAEDLASVISFFKRKGIEFLLLGNGSNMLVSDNGVKGAVVCTAELDNITVGKDGKITAEAGALLAGIARKAQRSGLSGFEFAGGIPGSLGGAVFMNAGAYDGQMAEIVEQTTYLDGKGEFREILGKEHGFGYRKSVFKEHPEWIVVRSKIKLEKGDPALILAKMNDFSQRRRDKQPLNYPSAGSTFKRPEGYFAGKLIEDAGLKGASIGAAQVSEKHAGFLINKGGASFDDMMKLIEKVRETVYEKFGVSLECEVRIIGNR